MVNGDVSVQINTKVNSEVAKWLEDNTQFRNKSNITSKALEFYHDYLFYKKGFFIRLIDLHFGEIKLLVRKIGRIKWKSSHNLS